MSCSGSEGLFLILALRFLLFEVFQQPELLQCVFLPLCPWMSVLISGKQGQGCAGTHFYRGRAVKIVLENIFTSWGLKLITLWDSVGTEVLAALGNVSSG